MRARKLTAADVCEVSGYNRDQLRALLNELPGWASAPKARKARKYSAHDLIVLSVVRMLDTNIGIRRQHISRVFPYLRNALLGPKKITGNARLAITFSPLHVDYLDDRETLREGVIVSLQPVFDRVDRYLSVGTAIESDDQVTLQLGPGLVGTRRKRV